MPQRMETLSKKVTEAGEKLSNEIENTTERVISRVEQMRKRVFDDITEHRSDRRRDSRANLVAVKQP